MSTHRPLALRTVCSLAALASALALQACSSDSTEPEPAPGDVGGTATGGAAATGGHSGATGGGSTGAGGKMGSGGNGSTGGSTGAGGTTGTGGAAAALAVSPHSATVAPGGSSAFTCNLPCTFSVQEGTTGGTVTANGTYTAPAQTGVYHVVAKAGGATDTATVTVPTAATGTPGKWENVTAAAMPASLFKAPSGFGAGNIVQDPHRPTDMYVGGYGSIWKSMDYGLTWSEVQSNPKPTYEALGHVLAVANDAGTTATLWMANGYGGQKVYRSADAGLTFTLTGTLTGGQDASLYSIVVDPYDSKHLISGFHETDGVAESTDAGDSWAYAGRTGWPSGGISWFPFFLDTGDAKTTRGNWLAIAQNGGSLVITHDGGATWAIPTGASGLNHPHGNAGIVQLGNTLFIAGTHSQGTSVPDGVYKSTDLGASFTNVNGASGLVFGSSKQLYVMWAWACAECKWDSIDKQDMTAPQPGTAWSSAAAAANGLNWGPNSVATTSDGTHAIYVGSMWSSGLWRYVEP